MSPKKKARRKNSEPILVLAMLAAAVVIGVAAGNYLARTGSENTPQSPDTAKSHARPGNGAPVRERSQECTPAHDRLPNQNNLKPKVLESQDIAHTPENQTNAKAGAQSTRGVVRSSALREPRTPASGELAPAGNSRLIALTFDAGASSEPTPSLLDTLRSAGLRVTFFLTGKWCERNESLVRRIANDGHEIANHTYSHRDLRKLTSEEIREELLRTDEIVLRITGQRCVPYFRPPYGSRDKRVIDAAQQAGFACVYWSLDSWDAFRRDITADEIKNRVLTRARAGDIVLMHCGSWATAEALPEIIRELESRGFRIAPVSELIASAR